MAAIFGAMAALSLAVPSAKVPRRMRHPMVAFTLLGATATCAVASVGVWIALLMEIKAALERNQFPPSPADDSLGLFSGFSYSFGVGLAAVAIGAGCHQLPGTEGASSG